jgi:hypothetical protein
MVNRIEQMTDEEFKAYKEASDFLSGDIDDCSNIGYLSDSLKVMNDVLKPEHSSITILYSLNNIDPDEHNFGDTKYCV